MTVGYQRLGRTTNHRKAMLRNLVTSLFKQDRIETTEQRAKEVKSIAEKLVTVAKRNDLAARRQCLEYIFEEDVVRKLFNDIAPKYNERPGGYTRIIRVGQRRGDAAEMVLLELI